MQVKRGTVSPLCKDNTSFRPVTLLEPFYQVVDRTMAKRLDALLTRRGLLNKSQRGFVLNGNCYQVIARVNMIYEVAFRDGRDARHLYLDAAAAFSTVYRTSPSTCPSTPLRGA